MVDFLGITLALSFWGLWKRLSAKIAEGGAEAVFLDQLRMHVVSLMQGIVMLLLITAVFLDSAR